MNILAIDTSGRHISLALFTERGLVLEYNEWVDNTISERLPGLLQTHVRPWIEDLSRLDALGTCIGPGPFTGIRIGLTVCKALIVHHGMSFLPVSSLKAMARRVTAPGCPLVALMDARREEYYMAVFQSSRQGLSEVQAPRMMALADLIPWLSRLEPKPLLCGLIDDAFSQQLESAGYTVVRTEPFLAREIVYLTLEEQDRWLNDAQLLRPLYLREPDAVVGTAPK